MKRLYEAAFEVAPTWILQCAAARQKWIDQTQTANLWLAENDARTASFVDCEVWERGLKTTYYLRTLNRSAIDSVHRDGARTWAETTEVAAVPKQDVPAEVKAACSIDDLRNGGTGEASRLANCTLNRSEC